MTTKTYFYVASLREGLMVSEISSFGAASFVAWKTAEHGVNLFASRSEALDAAEDMKASKIAEYKAAIEWLEALEIK